jgi:hypothetical protein
MAVSFVKVCYLGAPARRLNYIWSGKKANGAQRVKQLSFVENKRSTMTR